MHIVIKLFIHQELINLNPLLHIPCYNYCLFCLISLLVCTRAQQLQQQAMMASLEVDPSMLYISLALVLNIITGMQGVMQPSRK